MGHSTKGQSGQMGKNKEQITHIWYFQEKPKVKPPFNRKGNRRLSKKKQLMASNFKEMNS
jgi:hypothetical protein